MFLQDMEVTMEIERKWMVSGWPEDLPLLETFCMDQGYISVRPTVRIRREALQGGKTSLILCFKGAAQSHGLSRQEIEREIDEEFFAQLEELIGLELIHKERRTYLLADGHHLEVNLVDPDLPCSFMYAEIEYASEEEALSWDPASCHLEDYLERDCTGEPGSTMGEYWLQTKELRGV